MRSVDGYDLVRELARGGMGVVHEALDRATGRRVALKLLLAVSDPDARARFLIEGQAAARLRHPGIVAVHSTGQAGAVPYLVMDLVQGESLERRLGRAGPFAPREALRITAEVASALEHAHAQGIVHRDLKPSNVMLDEAGRALLTDFGLAKVLATVSDGVPLTRTGDLLGTPSYMAPEQLDGRGVDARTDVYGLGAILFALLTGRPPFQGPPLQVLAAVADAPPPRPSSLRGDVPRALDDLVLACLQKDPARRPASMAELARALSAQVLVRDPSRPSPAVARLAAALALLALGVGVAFVAWPSPAPTSPAPTSPAPTSTAPTSTAPAAPAAVASAAPAHPGRPVGPALAPLSPARAEEVSIRLGLRLPVSDDEVDRLVPSCEGGAPERLAQALVWRARSRWRRSLIEEALEDLERLRLVAPARADAEDGLRLHLLARTDREEALPLLDEALARLDVDPDRFQALAIARFRLVERTRGVIAARAGLRSLLDRLPPGDDRLLLAWSEAALHDLAVQRAALIEVVEVLGRAIDQLPTVPLLGRRADALVKLGRLPEAIDQLQRAITLDPTLGHLHLTCANYFDLAGAPLAAAESLERAATVEPNNQSLRHNIANVYESLELLDEALRHRREALALDPESTMLLDGLARTQALISERDRAPRR